MITDQMLAEAAAELNMAMINSLADPSQSVHQFSAKFERKMRHIIRKGNHPVRYRIVQRVASFILVLFLSFMTLVAVSPTVRAAVIGWIREKYDLFTRYYITNDITETIDSTEYYLSYVPSKYAEIQRHVTPAKATVYYANQDTNQLIVLTHFKKCEAVIPHLNTKEYCMTEIYINGDKGDFYQSNNTAQANSVFWFNSEESAYFYISAFADKNEIIKISESIKKVHN